MPLIKRSFYVPCKGEECYKLAELIREKAPVVEQIDIGITDSGLYITMYGYKTDIRNAWSYIKRLVSSYKSAVVEHGGKRRIRVDYVVERIGHTFPPKLLIEILKYKGYVAELSEFKNEIITNASLEVVEETASKIHELINEIRFNVRGTTTKYYVVAASILTGMKPEEVYRHGLELNHLVIEDEKYRIRVEWRSALREFLKAFREL